MVDSNKRSFYQYFYDKKYEFEDKQPFTTKQKQKYTVQDRNFIRYLQTIYNINKREAIKRFNKYTREIVNDKQKRNDFWISLKDQYEQLIKYQKRPKNYQTVFAEGNKKFLDEYGKKPKGYKYKLSAYDIPKDVKERFKLVNKKSRRYLDTQTGKEISRRERDKITISLSKLKEEL